MTDTPAERGAEGTWARLRRRKVVQWGFAYAAAAWVLLQVLEYFSGTFDWPRQIQQLTTVALLIGLPVALILAWYHGDRGQQRITTPELGMLTLALLLGGGVLWYFQRASETSTATSPAPTAAALPTDASIAVLPFVNMSADKEQEYFADGISEELLNLLAQVPELRVIARTSSFSFKGKDVDIAEIARRLNVANVLEGSVRKSGDKLRITAQLVRASDSSHLWSQTYDRNMTDVFAVQDEIASAVVLELKVALLGAPLKARETDPRSYVLFLQARDLARQGTSDSQKQAIDLYQKAVDVDPTHVAAWVGLANTHWLEVYGGGRTPDEGIRLAREAIQKALALDSGYAQAHALLGAIAITYDLDYLAAVQHIDRALALAPSNPDVIGIAGLLARRLGRHDQAIALFEYQVSQDPLNWAGHDDLAYANRYAGHLDKAIAEHRMELSLSPTINGPHSQIAEVLLQKGDTDAAIAELTLEPDEQFRLPVLSMARHAQRMEPESDAALAELIRKYHRTSAASIAMVFAFRSANDRAFEWLDKAKQQHDLALGSIAAYPMYANLHSDPRWLPFLRKLGMAPEQLAAIKFDVTVPR